MNWLLLLKKIKKANRYINLAILAPEQQVQIIAIHV